MADPNEELYSRIGPPPNVPNRYHLFGIPLNNNSREQAEYQLWLERAKQQLNPLNVGQAQTILGPQMTQGLATPQEMMQKTTMEPSAIPTYRSPMKEVAPFNPAPLQPPQMGFGNPYQNSLAQLDYIEDKVNRALNGPPQPYQVPQTNIRGYGGQPNLLQPTQGPPQAITQDVLNPNAPANPAMREQYAARTHAMSSPLFGRGSAALQTLGNKAELATEFFKSMGYPDTEAEAMGKGVASGAYNAQSMADTRKGKLQQGQRRLDQHDEENSIKQGNLAVREQLLELARQKREDEHRLAAQGKTPSEIAAGRLAWDQRKFKLLLDYALRNAGNITPDMQELINSELYGYATGGPVEAIPSGKNFLGTGIDLPLPGVKFNPAGASSVTPPAGGGTAQPVQVPKVETGGADAEMAKLQAIADAANKEYLAENEGKTMGNGKYILRKGKVVPNK